MEEGRGVVRCVHAYTLMLSVYLAMTLMHSCGTLCACTSVCMYAFCACMNVCVCLYCICTPFVYRHGHSIHVAPMRHACG